LLDRAALTAAERGAVIATSIVRHMRAYVHYHRGRLAEAVVDAEHSLEIYRFGWTESPWSTPVLTLAHPVATLLGSPSELGLAEARLELGGALRRAGRRTAAEAELCAALELAGRFEAADMVERARTELWMLGLRPGRTSTLGSDALTPSELTVAKHAAAGLSTPCVAHELCVTRRTVESHLYRIYRKLGISARGELAAALEL